MSVRNRYAGKYTKIMPFPPSAGKVPVHALSSKRHGDAAPPLTSDRRHRSKQTIADIMDEEYENVPVVKHRKNKGADYGYTVSRMGEPRRTDTDIALLSKNTNRLHQSREKRRNDNDAKSYTSVDGFEKLRAPKQRIGKEKKKQQKNEATTFSFHATGRAVQHSYQLSDDSDSDVLVEKAPRPKSARPESRWERRNCDSPQEMSRAAEKSSRQSRPKSARPESRLQRLYQYEVDDQGEGDEEADVLERPKTSHGRRGAGGRVNYIVASSSDSEQLDTSGYQNTGGNEKYVYDSDESLEELNQVISKKRTGTRNRKVKGKKSSRDKSNHVPSSHMLDDFKMASSRGEHVQLWRGSTLVDLKSGIDDIDLDVDPVLYFLQDDNVLADRFTRQPSLSKDAIEYIGNAKSSHQSNNLISHYGNASTKYNNKTETSDRNYGNRNSSKHYSTPECDKIQFNHDSNYQNKSNRGKRIPMSRDDVLSGSPSIDRYSSSKPPLPGYGSISVHRGAGNAPNPRATYELSSNKEFGRGTNLPVRKPRKLQPLSMSYYND